MTSEEETPLIKSAWEAYTDGSIRLSRTELSILFALAKINTSINVGKQFQHYYDLYNKDQNLLPKNQRPAFDLITSNSNVYVSLVVSLRKSQKFTFLPKFLPRIEDSFRKIACYKAVADRETLPLPEEMQAIKRAVIRLGMLEEYDDFVVVCPPLQSTEEPTTVRKMEGRLGDVFWKRHEEIYFEVLRVFVRRYFETIGTERLTMQLSDVLLLVIFILTGIMPDPETKEHATVVAAIQSIEDSIVSVLKEIEETNASTPFGESVNRIRRAVEIIKTSLSELSKKLQRHSKVIGGIQVVLTDSLKGFFSKQSTTPPYFPDQKALLGFTEVFSKRHQQEQLPWMMPDLHKLNHQSLIYAPFIFAYIHSGSIFCLMIPEPEKLFFWLKFYSTRTGAYRDDVKFSMGVTKTVVPFSEAVISNNRRSKDSLITRKPEEMMSPFDIRVDNKEGILLLNVINKGHAPVHVYLFSPGDFVPSEFSDFQKATSLWKQVAMDNPSYVISKETKKRIDEWLLLVQDPVPEVLQPVMLQQSSDSASNHPWRHKLDLSRLTYNAFRFPGMRMHNPVRSQHSTETRHEPQVKVTHNMQQEEFRAIILLNDFLRSAVIQNNRDTQEKDLVFLLEKMHARKHLEDVYPALCPLSKTEHLLELHSQKGTS